MLLAGPPAETFGHVLVRQLEVDPTRHRALLVVYREEALDLGEDVVEATGLEARLGGEACCRASDRRPTGASIPSATCRLDQRRQPLFDRGRSPSVR